MTGRPHNITLKRELNENAKQELFNGLSVDFDGFETDSHKLSERLATMRTEVGNKYRNWLSNPTGLAQEEIDERMWAVWAQEELNRVRRWEEYDLEGPNTVLCLDISASMEGDPFRQMVSLAKTFVKAIENNNIVENISLVTFGHETRVVKHLCKEYQNIISCIDKLRPDGPTPLGGGLFMALAAALGRGKLAVLRNVVLCQRIILISDGFATPDSIIAGPDETVDQIQQLHIKLHLNIIAKELKRVGTRC
ncbi:hypothetical protein KUTeg_017766 [Tegillarca granosa]|uniref:VWFA domain-containing protein n=1 Tax=Tegillarca granosa TaxID=220873 RepID=A0ABQ9ELQ2_TEGGR|nr:hypothetical protein KUTeg_017766 [Tegillarca granosa]